MNYILYIIVYLLAIRVVSFYFIAKHWPAKVVIAKYILWVLWPFHLISMALAAIPLCIIWKQPYWKLFKEGIGDALC